MCYSTRDDRIPTLKSICDTLVVSSSSRWYHLIVVELLLLLLLFVGIGCLCVKLFKKNFALREEKDLIMTKICANQQQLYNVIIIISKISNDDDDAAVSQ
jgi:hypothetical protein